MERCDRISREARRGESARRVEPIRGDLRWRHHQEHSEWQGGELRNEFVSRFRQDSTAVGRRGDFVSESGVPAIAGPVGGFAAGQTTKNNGLPNWRTPG